MTTKVVKGSLWTLAGQVLPLGVSSDDAIGAVAPKLLNRDGSLQASTWYFPPTPLKILVENFRLYLLLPPRLRANLLLNSHWDHNQRRTVPIVWGAAILFKGDLLRQLNGFDPDFYMYGEDMNICIRLLELGSNLEFVPTAEIIHLGGQSAIQSWSELEINGKKFIMGILFEKKNTGPLLFYSNCAMRLLVETVRFIGYKIIGRNTTRIKKNTWSAI